MSARVPDLREMSPVGGAPSPVIWILHNSLRRALDKLLLSARRPVCGGRQTGRPTLSQGGSKMSSLFETHSMRLYKTYFSSNSKRPTSNCIQHGWGPPLKRKLMRYIMSLTVMLPSQFTSPISRTFGSGPPLNA